MSTKGKKENNSSKKKIWFKDITSKKKKQQFKTNSKSKNNVSNKTQSTNKKIKTQQTNEQKERKNPELESKNYQSTTMADSFQQQLLSHIGDFIHITPLNANGKSQFEGVLCRVETDFIVLIDSLTIIEIPINKIMAVITQAQGKIQNKEAKANLSTKTEDRTNSDEDETEEFENK